MQEIFMDGWKYLNIYKNKIQDESAAHLSVPLFV